MCCPLFLEEEKEEKMDSIFSFGADVETIKRAGDLFSSSIFSPLSV